MDLIIHPNYLPSTSQFLLMANSKKLVFEINDHFLKQTFRNRTYIYGANGKLILSIPVIHSQKNRKLLKDVKISYSHDWPTQHWKSFQISYRSSPFFEYYEDKLIDLYKKRENVMLLVMDLIPRIPYVDELKEVDEILLDYLVNNSSDALIETVLDMYPDEVRERLR